MQTSNHKWISRALKGKLTSYICWTGALGNTQIGPVTGKLLKFVLSVGELF